MLGLGGSFGVVTALPARILSIEPVEARPQDSHSIRRMNAVPTTPPDLAEVPEFPRGFLLSDQRAALPPSYVPVEQRPGLYVHPWTVVDHAASGTHRVTVLGVCVPTLSQAQSSAAGNFVTALSQGEESFYRTLGAYCGRYAIIVDDESGSWIVQDATAMRAVFYAPGVASSHASLAASAAGAVEGPEIPFRYGYPGNGTPYTGIRLLSANTRLDVATGQVERFWPRETIPQRSAEEAATIVLEAAATALVNLARTHTPVMALTAGLDSRTLLAAAIHAGISPAAYTYGGGPATEIDRLVSADLAEKFGIVHESVPSRLVTPQLTDRLAQAHYDNHHRFAVAAMRAWVPDHHQAAALTANLLEIGRTFFRHRRRLGRPAPVTPRAMTELHYNTMGPTKRAAIEEYGYERYASASDAEFQRFLDDTDFARAAEVVDPLDLFYWEHRMSAWHGIAMAERDFYAEPFIPFNSRDTFEAMLGVSQDERDKGETQLELIRSVDARLLELPINPKVWPPEQP